MDKETLRKTIIKQRLELTNQEILTKSRTICQKIISTPEYKSSKVVYMYYAVNNEVSLRMIYDDCKKNNKVMAFPKVVGDQIKFCVAETEDDFEIGKFSIPEPKSNEEAPAPDIILVPGVAFSQDCMRIGYGGGFYRWLFSEEHTPYGSFGNGAAMRISSISMAIKDLNAIKKVCEAMTSSFLIRFQLVLMMRDWMKL